MKKEDHKEVSYAKGLRSGWAALLSASCQAPTVATDPEPAAQLPRERGPAVITRRACLRRVDCWSKGATTSRGVGAPSIALV